MIYFDFNMSKSTNTVVCFDWKTVIYIYVCGKCRTQFMLPMERSVTFAGACEDREVFTTSGTYPWSFVTQIFHNGQQSHGGNICIKQIAGTAKPSGAPKFTPGF
jgi:hypothetical protein